MPNIETELLNRQSTIGLNDLSNVGINPFAVQLVVESYRLRTKESGKAQPIRFAFDGVAITLQPFEPGNMPGMQAAESFPLDDMPSVVKIALAAKEFMYDPECWEGYEDCQSSNSAAIPPLFMALGDAIKDLYGPPSEMREPPAKG